jgi:hypothetical protein
MMTCSYVTLKNMGGDVSSVQANDDNSFWHAPDIKVKAVVKESVKLQNEKWTFKLRLRNFYLNSIFKIWEVHMTFAFVLSSLHLLVEHPKWGHMIATQHLNTCEQETSEEYPVSNLYASSWLFRRSVSLLRWVRRFEAQRFVINLLNGKLVVKIKFILPNYMKQPQIYKNNWFMLTNYWDE